MSNTKKEILEHIEAIKMRITEMERYKELLDGIVINIETHGKDLETVNTLLREAREKLTTAQTRIVNAKSKSMG